MKERQEEMSYATHDCSSYLYVCFYNGYKKICPVYQLHTKFDCQFLQYLYSKHCFPVSIPPFLKAVIYSLNHL